MHLFKSSLILLSLSFSYAVMGFSTNDCLKKNFSVQVDHKGFPFGLLEVKLGVEKSGCNITVNHQKFKYLNSGWTIDVCRGPVHIKKGTGAVDVIKKVNNCSEASKDDFCSELKEISTTIQDDGLIFASGIKEDIESDHGQIYCSYLLLQRYLQDSIVFNSANEYESDLENFKEVKKKEVKEIVAPRPVIDGEAVAPDESAEQEVSSPVEEAPSGEGSF